ncbi:MAG TPA: hypothetical protein VEC06_02030 [Paucimonas sp.]|nr:hypothetical protein [Paucimonas sp.]
MKRKALPQHSWNLHWKTIGIAITLVTTLAGCAAMIGTETQFTPWRGEPTILTGKGGAVETTEGIEFWIKGEPDKTFRVIGVISQIRSDDPFDNLIFGKFNRSQVADLVKQATGDGVVLLRSDRVGTDQGIQSNSIMAVFRYEKP